jgi:hypothetical protein
MCVYIYPEILSKIGLLAQEPTCAKENAYSNYIVEKRGDRDEPFHRQGRQLKNDKKHTFDLIEHNSSTVSRIETKPVPLERAFPYLAISRFQ